MHIDASQDTFINRSGDECDDGGNEDGSLPPSTLQQPGLVRCNIKRRKGNQSVGPW